MTENLENKSDVELVKESLSGDSQAFAQLVTRYFGMVHAIAYARLGQHESAEDLTQEVFLRVHLYLRELREPRHFSAWLTRITRNLAMNWQREGRRRSHLLTFLSLEETGADAVDPKAREEREEMLRMDEQRVVRKAMSHLEPETREIVLLHYSEEMGVVEIARHLGIHRITVRRHLQKAVATLRAEVEPMLADSARAWKPSRTAVGRAIGIIGAVSLVSAPAKSALAASAAVGQLSAATKSAGFGLAGVTGLLQYLWAATYAWLAGGAKTMAIGKGTAAIIAGISLGAGFYGYHELKEPVVAFATQWAAEKSPSALASSDIDKGVYSRDPRLYSSYSVLREHLATGPEEQKNGCATSLVSLGVVFALKCNLQQPEHRDQVFIGAFLKMLATELEKRSATLNPDILLLMRFKIYFAAQIASPGLNRFPPVEFAEMGKRLLDMDASRLWGQNWFEYERLYFLFLSRHLIPDIWNEENSAYELIPELQQPVVSAQSAWPMLIASQDLFGILAEVETSRAELVSFEWNVKGGRLKPQNRPEIIARYKKALEEMRRYTDKNTKALPFDLIYLVEVLLLRADMDNADMDKGQFATVF